MLDVSSRCPLPTEPTSRRVRARKQHPADRERSRLRRRHLEHPHQAGLRGHHSRPGRGFAHASSHQLVIIDVIGGARTALDVCRDLRTLRYVVDRGPVHQPYRPGRGAIHFWSGRGRRHGRPSTRASSRPGRGVSPLPRPRPLANRGGRRVAHAERDGPCRVSPKWRRHDDDRGECALIQAQGKPDKGPDRSRSHSGRPLHITSRSRHAGGARARRVGPSGAALLRTYAMRHDSGLHVIAAPTPDEAEGHRGGPRRSALKRARVVRGSGHRRGVRPRQRPHGVRARGRGLLPLPGDPALRSCGRCSTSERDRTLASKSTFVLNNMFARGR